MEKFAEDLVKDERTGQIWRKKKAHPEIGNTHSLTEIHKYLKSFEPDALAPSESTARDVPYGSIQDWTSSMRNCCAPGGGHFRWPSNSMGFQKCLAVALHHCPSGHMVIIRNKHGPPETLTSGSRTIETGIIPLGDYIPEGVEVEGLKKEIGGSRKTEATPKKATQEKTEWKDRGWWQKAWWKAQLWDKSQQCYLGSQSQA